MSSIEYVDNPIIPRLSFDPSSTIRPETIRHHLRRYELAARYIKIGSSAVDVCCGVGYGTDLMRQAGAASTVGVDLSEAAIESAKATYPGNEFVHADANLYLRARVTSEQGRPDVVTFFEAIEHVPREVGHQILDSVQIGLAKDDGHFFMSTPSDIRADVNPDHITQWEFAELEDALSERFNDVNLFGQDWASGEFVYDEPEGASFFVAHCSNPKDEIKE